MQATGCVLLMLGVMVAPLGTLAAPTNQDLENQAPETTPATWEPVSDLSTAQPDPVPTMPTESFEHWTWEELLLISSALLVVIALLALQLVWLVIHSNEEAAAYGPDVLPASARYTVSYIANPPPYVNQPLPLLY